MNSQVINLPLLISALALLISFVSFVYFKSYLKRRTSQERILAELQEEVNGILRSINDATDRNISLIEDSEKRLKRLLGEIEKRLGVYVREMERFGNNGTDSKPATTQYLELGKNRYRLGKPSQAQATEQAKTPELTQTPEPTQAPEPGQTTFPIPNFEIKAGSAEPPPLAEQVRSLLHSGFSAPIVAGRLGVSIAEVELVAALLERREE